jgi:hypothetical protein
MPAFARNADDRKARAEGAWLALRHEVRNAASAAFRANPSGRDICGRSALSRLLALARANGLVGASRGSSRKGHAAGIMGSVEPP